MKIRIAKNGTKMVGSLRLSEETYGKIENLAKKEGVTNQEVIRAILDQVIDEVEV